MTEEELKAIEDLNKYMEEDKLIQLDTRRNELIIRTKSRIPVETHIETLLNLINKQQKKIENIKKEVQEHIAFENRLKRDNTEPDLFNQGRFYVANNIKDILDGKEIR